MRNVFLALIAAGLAVAAYGLYECNVINDMAVHMGHKAPKENLQSELCIKAGCYYVSEEDKESHEFNSLVTAVGVFIFVVSLFLKRIHEKFLAKSR
ncbi:hypothetical protein [Acidovorax sp. BL-A-41-H1]|uniref:hypothetical protein n=1 Tax=Acidovorax sp. BL-A-41-H1 TaxID=3421102 RepID=UPI003F793662